MSDVEPGVSTMRSIWRVGAFVVFALFSTPALPWGAAGHQQVGAIADELLAGSNAGQKVQEILGFKLQQAGPWADCIRNVEVKNKVGTYTHSDQFGAPCVIFEGPDEKRRMENYAERNWDKCTPEAKGKPCHEEYHFADVSVHHYDYRLGLKGTFKHDIVQAINAAIEKLQDKEPRAPFDIIDKKEALFMLAHFVGDLHQPLHIGSVYLDARGKLVNPDRRKVLDRKTLTNGGNSLKDGNANLHSVWDRSPLGGNPDAALIEKARMVRSTAGDVADWAATWASESVRASHTAFTGLTFSARQKTKDNKLFWNMVYNDRAAYAETQGKLQRDHLAKGGARLAELLKKIWP